MTIKTKSEVIFESFCKRHGLVWEKIPEEIFPTPDYVIYLDSQTIYFELKQIDNDKNFDKSGKGASSSIVGSHIRKKISDSKKQVQTGAKKDASSVLLVYNNLDPLQSFGTEQCDFIAAMYGEMTLKIRVNDSQVVDSFQGRNSSLQESHNTSFSAVGHLSHTIDGASILLYENIYALNPLDIELLPSCIEFRRIEPQYLSGF